MNEVKPNTPKLSNTKITTRVRPKVTSKKPIGKILSRNFLKKNPNDAPIGIPTKVEKPATMAAVELVPMPFSIIMFGNL